MIKEVYKTKSELDSIRQKPKYTQPERVHIRSTSRPSSETNIITFLEVA